MTRSNLYYAIEHPLFGESVLEYDRGSRTPLDLTGKTKATCLPNNEILLFRLEPANYTPAQGEEVPTLAQLIAESRGLAIFQKSNQFSMNQVTPQKAKEIQDFYRQKQTQ